MTEDSPSGLLEGVRVLDLANDYTSAILADLVYDAHGISAPREGNAT